MSNAGGGGGDNTTMIIAVACCCSCVVVLGIVAYIAMNADALASFKSSVGVSDTGAVAAVEEPLPASDDAAAPDAPTTGDTTADPAASEDGGGDTGGGGGDDNVGSDNNTSTSANCEEKGECQNKTKKKWFCPKPWERDQVNYDKNGLNPKCCLKSKSNYKDKNDCATLAMEMKAGATNDYKDRIHENLKKLNTGGRTPYEFTWADYLNPKPCPCNAALKASFIIKSQKNGIVDQLNCLSLTNGISVQCYPKCANGDVPGPKATSCFDKNKKVTGNIMWKKKA